MNIDLDLERVTTELDDEITAAIRAEIVNAVRLGAARAINAGVAAYYTTGPGKQALAEALEKSLAGKPIHV